jgi:hypothetical protein
VVGRDALQRPAEDLDLQRLHLSAEEHVVYSEHRPARGEGRARPVRARLGALLGVAQTPGQPPVGARTRYSVEVAKQDRGPPSAVRVPEPAFAEQSIGLRQALAAQQAEVRVDHLQLRPTAEVHGDPERAARLPRRRARQRPGLDQAQRQRAQDRVAVPLLLHAQGGMEMEAHAESAGDGVRLVEAAAARAPGIELLKRHDIGPRVGDHGRDPLGREPPVRAAAAMDVVGEDPERGSSARTRPRQRRDHLPPRPRTARAASRRPRSSIRRRAPTAKAAVMLRGTSAQRPIAQIGVARLLATGALHLVLLAVGVGGCGLGARVPPVMKYGEDQQQSNL